jgi:hypothetical protein
MAENKCARILAAVLFQIGQYALVRQIQFPRVLPVAAPYLDQSLQYAFRLGFNRQLTSRVETAGADIDRSDDRLLSVRYYNLGVKLQAL